ncbi:Regulatory protein PpaA [Sulfitobacter noctilucicola]|uniref:Methylmalonyl-CoA mutase cobalamin-binding subunit n=1 Tax=Sulfitobacter noctilucicola TaxID=1342301 RepID=A0A7W6MBM0_9RHOB|nr:cobalamin B12-binding domain-containing protein [Sulfitobacter noctilucicola]KIN69978.1 Regulatory protein PpaA [Sulfitobacter noctilucicola]MBB4176085.1 methylmalonyl-CoA mutase cobalamin-binding subunit [Sulfitobacter noctilucicola]
MSSGNCADQKSGPDEVNRVALQVLSTIAPAHPCDPRSRKPFESYLGQMYKAVLAREPGQLYGVIKEMRRARIESAIIAEMYVPVVARRLGEAWLHDTLDFAAVTIASARLQGILWKLENDWAVPHEKRHHCPPAFLVGVPAGVQHTLGATIVAGQLRHRGMSVHLDIELTATDIAQYVRNQELSGVLLSASSPEHLDFLRILVDISHQQSRKTPVFIGGAILEHTDAIREITGADLVTSDVQEVLQFCEAGSVPSRMRVPLLRDAS